MIIITYRMYYNTNVNLGRQDGYAKSVAELTTVLQGQNSSSRYRYAPNKVCANVHCIYGLVESIAKKCYTIIIWEWYFVLLLIYTGLTETWSIDIECSVRGSKFSSKTKTEIVDNPLHTPLPKYEMFQAKTIHFSQDTDFDVISYCGTML